MEGHDADQDLLQQAGQAGEENLQDILPVVIQGVSCPGPPGRLLQAQIVPVKRFAVFSF